MKHRSAFLAFLQMKCPRCRQGDMFKHPPFSAKFMDMHEHCPKCGLKYEVEPGFFWGSMYVSYAFTVGISLVLGTLIFFVLNDPNVWVYLGIIGGVLVIGSPWLFRYSRSLMLHLFGSVQYDPKSLERKEEERV